MRPRLRIALLLAGAALGSCRPRGDGEAVRFPGAPVVLISANGLICLALYNRLAVVVGRVRSFSRERFDSLSALGSDPAIPVGPAGSSWSRWRHRERLAMLEE